MSKRLDKAIAAMDAARVTRNPEMEEHLIRIATAQACLAAAEALELLVAAVPTLTAGVR